MKTSSTLVATLLASGLCAADPAVPQTPTCGAAAHQFDFWIGHWRVTEKGQHAGDSRIERILGGCALLEHWQGAKGGAGKSLNFFDRGDGLWHQTWIDGSGGALFLSGSFVDGVMRLAGERPATDKLPAQRHRITWTAQSGGTVRQTWESAPVGKDEWQVQFDGVYAPAAN